MEFVMVTRSRDRHFYTSRHKKIIPRTIPVSQSYYVLRVFLRTFKLEYHGIRVRTKLLQLSLFNTTLLKFAYADDVPRATNRAHQTQRVNRLVFVNVPTNRPTNHRI